MGTTGASDKVSSSLSSMLARIRKLIGKPVPLAVGFGVSTQEHFEEVGRDADGVVIGSQLVSVIKDANALGTSAAASAVEAYCQRVSGNRTRAAPLPKQTVSDEDKVKEVESVQEKVASAARFGDFGGAYVPEALYDALEELTTAYADARADPKFWEEWNSHMGYINRPSQIYEAKRLSEQCGGARIWFKREDLNHTGSHKVRTAYFPLVCSNLLVDSPRSTMRSARSCSLAGSARPASSPRRVPDSTVSRPRPPVPSLVSSASSTWVRRMSDDRRSMSSGCGCSEPRLLRSRAGPRLSRTLSVSQLGTR